MPKPKEHPWYRRTGYFCQGKSMARRSLSPTRPRKLTRPYKRGLGVGFGLTSPTLVQKLPNLGTIGIFRHPEPYLNPGRCHRKPSGVGCFTAPGSKRWRPRRGGGRRSTARRVVVGRDARGELWTEGTGGAGRLTDGGRGEVDKGPERDIRSTTFRLAVLRTGQRWPGRI